MSEIDDIFASKGKSKAAPVPSDESSLPRKKKKDKKKSNAGADDGSSQSEAASSKKRPAPETIVDPSVQLRTTKRHKTGTDPINTQSKRPQTKPETKEEEFFKDSRGTGPRRKTEEGWNIYKEDELGITDAGGDTPLCPFDCECCF